MKVKLKKHSTKLGRKLQHAFANRGVLIGLKEKVAQLPGNRRRFKVVVMPETRVADIAKVADDVRRTLKLDLLKVEIEHDAVYLILSKKLEEGEYLLVNLLNSPEYREAREVMGLAHPVGVDDLGYPIIIDLADSRFPHAVVCGTSGSGKSCGLKALLLTLLSYQPEMVNLIIGDAANELTQFSDLPHLAYPLIEDFHTLLKVLLILQDEMERRIFLKGSPQFDRLPFIVVVIDEFNSFMAEATDKEKLDLSVAALSQLLRRGRHARIHFVLAAHNPTKDNMKIDTSDLPVKMVFRVSNQHNSLTALGAGGAEKLRGNGDMLFKGASGIQHLQGAFITHTEIDELLAIVRYRDRLDAHPDSEHRVTNGFTITEAILRQKEKELRTERIHPSFRQSTKANTELLFASVLMWALEQEEISCNQIAEGFSVGWRRANDFIVRLHELGIVGDLDAKLPRKVLVHSLEDAPPATTKLLRSSGAI